MPLTVSGMIPPPKPVEQLLQGAGWRESNKLSNRFVRSEDDYHYTWEQAVAIELATLAVEKTR